MSLSYILQELDDPDFDDIHGDDETGGFAADKGLRLLVSSLYTSWRPPAGTAFLAAIRVPIGNGNKSTSTLVVPDLLAAQGVEPSGEWWKPVNRIYHIARFGKPPEVVLDVLASPNRPEAYAARHQTYEQLGVVYRVVYDPCHLFSGQTVTVFERQGNRLLPRTDTHLPLLGLGLTLWRGTFEGRDDTWLRWTNANGELLLTGDELADLWRRHTIPSVSDRPVTSSGST